MTTTQVWGVGELARAAGVSENTVRRDIETSILTAHRVGGRWMIPHHDGQTYIEYRKQINASQAALAGLRAAAKERKDRRDRRRTP